ncbi:MAG: ThiF family adenylyltransferase [Phycisphaerales bacterium]|nr:ThiF family adenylyltransferase [Phycisphaerales bacterium]
MMNLQRYHRQMLLPDIGQAGQQRLCESHALIVGCGALGSVLAEMLARAGVGTLMIVDRDCVEPTNLQRQILFDQADADHGVPKAVAAQRRIARINPDVTVHPIVDDFNDTNAERIALELHGRADILLDGLDNFETRYLLNDLAVRFTLPYVYGGAVGMTGMTMPILPRTDDDNNAPWTDAQHTPCLRCLFEDAPPVGSTPTCDTAGILGPVASIIANYQAVEAIKILLSRFDRIRRSLLTIDVWTNQLHEVPMPMSTPDCPACGKRAFPYLDGERTSHATSLCGRRSVQIIAHGTNSAIDLHELAARLSPHGTFSVGPFTLCGTLNHERGDQGEPIQLTVFPNGRTIVKGTNRIDIARTIHAKYIGT